MKFVPNSVTSKVAHAALRVNHQSPTILFAAGVVGVGATVVLACKATLKLDDLIKDAEKTTQDIQTTQHANYTEHDRKKDLYYHRIGTAGRLVKLYAPSAAVGVLSVAALTQSNRILTQRNVALTAAYATIEKAFNEYRARVRDELGDEKDRHFRYGKQERQIAVETDTGTDVKTVITVPDGKPSGYAKFFDTFNPNWQPNAELNLYWLKCQQNWLNNKLQANGHLFLNDVYEQLGFEKTDAGQVVGWWIGPDSDGDGYVDFGVFDANNDQARDFVNGYEKAILLDFNVDGVVYNKLARRS